MMVVVGLQTFGRIRQMEKEGFIPKMAASSLAILVMVGVMVKASALMRMAQGE